jgi:predicted aspartyl protease
VKLQVRDGRPIVNGVYVNGHGPYRFLVDTGANINLIETGIAQKIGMTPTFQVDLASAAGKVPVSGSDGSEIVLDSAKADGQKFLFSGLDAIHNSLPDVQGVLGEWFLSRFDYTLDMKGKLIEFGKQERSGLRTAYKVINARPVVSTSLGDLALDSGAGRLTLFGVRSDVGGDLKSEWRTIAGAQKIGVVSGKPLVIDGRRIWEGDAVAIPNRPEAGVDGLLPLGLFKTIYVCNSEGYVVFE